MKQSTSTSLEIWGGLECTINRVRDRYINQISLNGHYQRVTDLDLFASLGIKKIRYPVLWEAVAPESLESLDWEWSDSRMSRLRELGLVPIVGLLHHGSGPVYTSLLDPEFPQKLARYASLVAKRYPWVEWYTPVNEPLTTARFSALYGHWYPHHRDNSSMVRALLNELKGTALAMAEIRKVNSKARLVQTEDFGRVIATPPIQYQAEWENNRRWLTFDILLGRVDHQHPMFKYLSDHGASESELEWFMLHPCPPDIIGINHYPLSNRLLDHRLELYPERYHGGNGRDRYADVGAVDSGQTIPPAPIEILLEVWERYKRPFAVTEVHIGGPREAQMRWLHEVHLSAKELSLKGVDIRAITGWCLLGSYDWPSLCTETKNIYEPGIFDHRGKQGPRQLALAKMLKSFASGEEPSHPVLAQPGYWHLPSRVLFAPSDQLKPSTAWFTPTQTSQPIVITGARGTLGGAFARVCEKRGIPFVILTRQQMDIGDLQSVRDALRSLKPWAVVNAAGYVRVDEAEFDRDRCIRENTQGPKNLAVICNELKILFLTFSSDLVFDGNQSEPYGESHPVKPLNVYGLSKAQAERQVLQISESMLVIRTSSFFSPWDEFNFAHQAKHSLLAGEVVRAAQDVVVSPTYVPDLVASSLDLLIDGATGLIHLTNQGQISWANWAHKVAISVGCANQGLVQGCSISEFNLPAARPQFSALTSERMHIMPPFEDAWERYLRAIV